jgi:hypothetical protein
MADGENRKYWMSAQFEEDDRDALMLIASHEGKHVSKIIELACQEFIAAWVSDEDNPDDPEVKLRRIALDTRKIQNKFVMLKQLAYAYNDAQTDELAGMEMEVVLETINKTSTISETKVISTSPNSLQAAEMWLEELVIDSGKLYPVSEIQEMAKERGFKWYTVTTAKKKRKIQSVKDGLSWYWIRSPSEDPLPEDQVPGDDVF